MKPLTNKHNLPLPVVLLASADSYTREVEGGPKIDISVTGLLEPPQLGALKELHWDEIEEDVADKHATSEGKALHEALRAAAQGVSEVELITERRLYTEILGWHVSGQADLFIFKESGKAAVVDYKRTHTYALQFDKPDWAAQLNMYAYLFEQAGYPSDEIYVIASLRDWLLSRARKQADYPPAPWHRVDLPKWSSEQTLAYMEERVRLHQRARAGEYIPCTDDERWWSERDKRFNRCEDYCRSAPWCTQFGGHV